MVNVRGIGRLGMLACTCEKSQKFFSFFISLTKPVLKLQAISVRSLMEADGQR
jgi:hypothetical protein